ncbi:MAG: phosphomannomutase/phosphoglucomutase [Candidatus Woesearchaeota archaeon]|jgi:phosphomannomutase|nr:phosphomannomutase/phosphoglucomutase [Candidatus Woesearchaeota archaeon]
MSIFKAYDIRGKYPYELNEDIAYNIGKAAAKFFKAKEIAVGRDMRLSGDSLFTSLSEGITDMGVDMIDIGLCSSPMASFASGFLKKPVIMVTASHNPKEYNGFKIMGAGAKPVSADSGIKDIEKMASSEIEKSSKRGMIVSKNIDKDYIKHIMKFCRLKDIKMKIVVDTSNGMAGKFLPMVAEKLKSLDIVKMNFKIDGNFPGHDPNPLKPEIIDILRQRVLKEKADLGVAFDGDADRVFFVSDKGDVVTSDYITCLIGQNMLKDNKGGMILYDLRSSWIVKEFLEAEGGKTKMSKVGHSFIKEQMRKDNGIFAGELSGHFYFKDNFYADSGIIGMLQVLCLLSGEGKEMSELIKPLQKYFSTGELNSDVSDKEGKIKALKAKYKDGKISMLDGIRVDYSDWWFNVRPSNTESLLRLNLEAKSKEIMEEKKKEILDFIRK